MNAKQYATLKHHGQVRKGSGIPYISHPIRVAQKLQQLGITDQEIIDAAYLHDILEDTNTTLEELQQLFTPRTCLIVQQLTRLDTQTKAEYLKTFEKASLEAGLIKLADRLDNINDWTDMPLRSRAGYSRKALDIIRHVLRNKQYKNNQYQKQFNTLITELVANTLNYQHY